MCFPTDVGGQVRNHGCYDPVPYKYWSYPRSARNYFENLGVVPTSRLNRTRDLRLSDRYLLPRYLCFLDSRTQLNPRGRLEPAEWMKKQGSGTQSPAYIFLSYTGQGQFERLCDKARAQVKNDPSFICSCK